MLSGNASLMSWFVFSLAGGERGGALCSKLVNQLRSQLAAFSPACLQLSAGHCNLYTYHTLYLNCVWGAEFFISPSREPRCGMRS